MHILIRLCSLSIIALLCTPSLHAAAEEDVVSQILFCTESLEQARANKKPGARTAGELSDDESQVSLTWPQPKQRKLLDDAPQHNIAGTMPEQLAILDDYLKLTKYPISEVQTIFPMLVTGEPGSGKTTWIRALALKHNFPTTTINTQDGKPHIDSIRLDISEACLHREPTLVIIEHIDAWLEIHREKIVRILRTAQTKHPHIMFIGESPYAPHIDIHRQFETVAHIPLPHHKERQLLLSDFARGLLPADLDSKALCKSIGGATAAEIKKIVDQAQIAMFAAGHHHLTLENLQLAARRVMTPEHAKLYEKQKNHTHDHHEKPTTHMYS